MKPTPKVLLAVAIIVSSAVLVELFTVLPRPVEREPQGQVLGIMTWVKKQAAKLKINVKKKASPTPTRVGAPPPATPHPTPVRTPPPSPPPAPHPASPSASAKATPDRQPVPPGGTPSPVPTPPALTPPAQPQSSLTPNSPAADLSSLEREITLIYQAGNIIGPDHYQRLKSELDSKAAAGADAAKIKQLREWLATVNPAKVASTSPSSSQQSQPTPQSQSCAGTRPVLTADISDFSKIQKITAPGSSSSEGPKGHSFIWTAGQRVPVYAPVAALLDSGSYSADNADSPAQYLIMFQVKENCNFQFKFDHIDEPIAAIKAALPAVPKTGDSRTTAATNRVELQAGDLIGYTSGTRQAGNWDFGLYNMKEEGVLAQAGSYGLHRHSVCWVDYYAPGKQEQYRRLLEGPKLVCSF